MFITLSPLIPLLGMQKKVCKRGREMFIIILLVINKERKRKKEGRKEGREGRRKNHNFNF